MNSRRRRSGYVLLAVLAVMVLMVTVLAALSDHSLRRALAAADARLRLQQRLGAQSIERTLLPEAAKVFDRLEAQSDAAREMNGVAIPPVKQIRGAVTIGGVTFDVVLADEDAKLNLNQVYHMTGQRRTEATLAKVLGPIAGRAVRLLPATGPMTAAQADSGNGNRDDDSEEPVTEIPRAFRSWGEVFDLPRLSSGLGSDAALPAATGELTCWGGDGLNVRRASETSIQAAAGCVLSDAGARRLVSRYRDNPATSLAILLQQEAKTETERLRLRRMLVETSTHFSLWIDASVVARRSLRTFSVTQTDQDGFTKNERFSF
ncbi:hypothetical protein Mal15_69570 [Stieleria maiorica]|uniref:General secretion pathway protein K n=1 Tax=Stieleria maiorica TaxID=2795974 RepID=A0A5B9MSP6_9BACT|nr:hypothetical protein [Stieleria maiorica]QEG02836.1 hypothetical protein Mal15_69570 [Stieleria maiorica]